MSANFRERLRNGEVLLGTLLTLASPEVAELLAQAGFDWLFIDGEHGTFDARSAQAMLQGAGKETACLVRVQALDESAISKALDIGADGIIVPQVHSAQQAERVVRAARYPPAGARGLGVARAQGYGLELAEYLRTANERVAVVVQAESAGAVNDIESIAQVPGIDAVLIGPNDLSASLGRPGEVAHPEVRQAIAHVAQACRAAGLPVGIFGMTAEAVRPYIDQGFTLIVTGVDTVLLGNAARDLLSALRRPG